MFQLLIADDEYIEREALKSIINQKFPERFVIAESSNGLDVVQQAKSLKPDIIFMDIKMPGQSGIDAVRQIREFLPDIDIIIITAYDYFDYAKEAISLKVSEFLIKPIDIRAVIDQIGNLIGKLEKKQESQKYNFEIESKLEIIKMKYEQEFMELLQRYNTTPTILQEYLNIIDYSFVEGIAVIIDFANMVEEEFVGKIQKEFICTRFLNRIKSQSEKFGLKCMQQNEENMTLLLFFISNTLENEEESGWVNKIDGLIEESRNNMSVIMEYQCSKLIDRIEDLPTTVYEFKQSFLSRKRTYSYPYEIEEKLIANLGKKNFLGAKECISELVKEFTKQGKNEVLQREVHGLYAAVRRCLKNLSKESLMPEADNLVENIEFEYDVISFFNRLFDYAENNMEQKSKKNQLLVQKICDYLEEHYQEDISLDEAANIIGFSSFYFSKLMKEYCNMSYVDYVSAIRMKKAMHFFDTTDQTISQIATLVGYSDPNYFTRVFKKVVGKTPSAYKEELKK